MYNIERETRLSLHNLTLSLHFTPNLKKHPQFYRMIIREPGILYVYYHKCHIFLECLLFTCHGEDMFK